MQGQPALDGCHVMVEEAAAWAAIDVLVGKVGKVLLAEAAVGLGP